MCRIRRQGGERGLGQHQYRGAVNWSANDSVLARVDVYRYLYTKLLPSIRFQAMSSSIMMMAAPSVELLLELVELRTPPDYNGILPFDMDAYEDIICVACRYR